MHTYGAMHHDSGSIWCAGFINVHRFSPIHPFLAMAQPLLLDHQQIYAKDGG